MDKRPPSENTFFRPSKDGPDGHNMLLVHQTAFMIMMLARFGNTIVCLDATYKITKWGFALFILCVITNYGFAVPVGIFFVRLLSLRSSTGWQYAPAVSHGLDFGSMPPAVAIDSTSPGCSH